MRYILILLLIIFLLRLSIPYILRFFVAVFIPWFVKRHLGNTFYKQDSRFGKGSNDSDLGSTTNKSKAKESKNPDKNKMGDYVDFEEV